MMISRWEMRKIAKNAKKTADKAKKIRMNEYFNSKEQYYLSKMENAAKQGFFSFTFSQGDVNLETQLNSTMPENIVITALDFIDYCTKRFKAYGYKCNSHVTVEKEWDSKGYIKRIVVRTLTVKW